MVIHKEYMFKLAKLVLMEYGINQITFYLGWINFQPAGLKLNPELNAFLNHLFLWMVKSWQVILLYSQSFGDNLFSLTLICNNFGLSFGISIVMDIISISTIHVMLFYIIACRLYRWNLNIITSAFNLFRGRKWNPLRKRIDSASYDIDQLLIGAVIFALFCFLLPTITVYYVLFSMAVSFFMIILSFFQLFLAFLNHFPLFSIILYIIDSKRLPSSIYSNEFRWYFLYFSAIFIRVYEISQLVPI